MTRAEHWRGIGRTLAQRYYANVDVYAAAGYADGDAYRRAFVAHCWPNVGEHVRRQIRAGWRSVEAAAA